MTSPTITERTKQFIDEVAPNLKHMFNVDLQNYNELSIELQNGSHVATSQDANTEADDLPATSSKVDALTELFKEALDFNPYFAYEIGYTRVTGWMVHIWTSEGVGLAKAPKLVVTQEEDIEEACNEAIELFTAYLVEKYPNFSEPR